MAGHSTPTVEDLSHMTIHLLPACDDNYMYLLVDKATKEAAVVDPHTPRTVSALCAHSVMTTTHCTK